MNKPIRLFTVLAYLVSMLAPLNPSAGYAQQLMMPAWQMPVGGVLGLSDQPFFPVILRGVAVDPQSPLQFEFLVDSGQDGLSQMELERESLKLIRYFMAALTAPEEEIWVNLSPEEPDRIIPEALGFTELGRDMLVQDYLLKQMTSSLIFLDHESGQKFWDNVRARAFEEFGTSDLPVNTFNKVWIVPDRAVVSQFQNQAVIKERHLKVMLEEDYKSFQKLRKESEPAVGIAEQSAQADTLARDIIRDIIIPELEQEVNHGETFANLRQMYNAMILATWYKIHLKQSLLGQIYIDQKKVKGIDLAESDMKQKVYESYVESFRQGVFDFIREEYDPVAQTIIPRKYFSGGLGSVSPAMLTIEPSDRAMIVAPESPIGSVLNIMARFIPSDLNFRVGKIPSKLRNQVQRLKDLNDDRLSLVDLEMTFSRLWRKGINPSDLLSRLTEDEMAALLVYSAITVSDSDEMIEQMIRFKVKQDPLKRDVYDLWENHRAIETDKRVAEILSRLNIKPETLLDIDRKISLRGAHYFDEDVFLKFKLYAQVFRERVTDPDRFSDFIEISNMGSFVQLLGFRQSVDRPLATLQDRVNNVFSFYELLNQYRDMIVKQFSQETIQDPLLNRFEDVLAAHQKSRPYSSTNQRMRLAFELSLLDYVLEKRATKGFTERDTDRYHYDRLRNIRQDLTIFLDEILVDKITFGPERHASDKLFENGEGRYYPKMITEFLDLEHPAEFYIKTIVRLLRKPVFPVEPVNPKPKRKRTPWWVVPFLLGPLAGDAPMPDISPVPTDPQPTSVEPTPQTPTPDSSVETPTPDSSVDRQNNETTRQFQPGDILEGERSVTSPSQYGTKSVETNTTHPANHGHERNPHLFDTSDEGLLRVQSFLRMVMTPYMWENLIGASPQAVKNADGTSRVVTKDDVRYYTGYFNAEVTLETMNEHNRIAIEAAIAAFEYWQTGQITADFGPRLAGELANTLNRLGENPVYVLQTVVSDEMWEALRARERVSNEQFSDETFNLARDAFLGVDPFVSGALAELQSAGLFLAVKAFQLAHTGDKVTGIYDSEKGQKFFVNFVNGQIKVLVLGDSSKTSADQIPEAKADSTSGDANQAMVSQETYGGIDFNPAHLNLRLEGTVDGQAFSFDSVPAEIMNAEGFVPVLIHAVPQSSTVPWTGSGWTPGL